jgi:hypothetical protein
MNRFTRLTAPVAVTLALALPATVLAGSHERKRLHADAGPRELRVSGGSDGERRAGSP